MKQVILVIATMLMLGCASTNTPYYAGETVAKKHGSTCKTESKDTVIRNLTTHYESRRYLTIDGESCRPKHD